ncbi:MAG TPA: 50S ribosomal protein L11 methyltransferase [Pyrinomonadaceae bacterium]|nr:50S ribosomal protein L11 methyltransferase [Pyrinomonadaceae bacterium]
MSKEQWYALDVDVEPQAVEAVEYALMEAGAGGTETATDNTDVTRIVGYFEGVPDRERVRNQLFEALRIYELPSSSVRDMNVREVEQRDWLEEWKKNWQPVQVGRFIIAPPWSELDDKPDRCVIRIEPGMAFGTGTHETTRLCLAAMQSYFEGGSFLDVGTGTGILAIAAASCAPGAHVEAYDIDADAVQIARENAVANGVAERINFHVGSIDEQTSSADFICANLTAEVIAKMLPTLVALSCGRLVLSGILETQIEGIVAQLGQLAITDVEIARDGEWVAIIV